MLSLKCSPPPPNYVTHFRMCVVYFDQHLGAAHCKRWLKYDFLMAFVQKAEKRKKKPQNIHKFEQQNVFLEIVLYMSGLDMMSAVFTNKKP